MKRKLKNLTVPAIYLVALLVFGTSLYLVQKVVNTEVFSSKEKMEYVDNEIVNDDMYVPVVVQTNIFIKPYVSNDVKINKSFYDINEEIEKQENSIIFYENTYIQNSGVSYTHTEQFEVVSVLDGTVIEVTENEILGTTVKIRHDNDIISTYQSLSNVNIVKDSYVVRGQVIGLSGTSKIFNKDFNLHFELTYQGKNINPENYYNRSTDEL